MKFIEINQEATVMLANSVVLLDQQLAAQQQRKVVGLTMNINFTKKPMKPITTKPIAVLEQILLNSANTARNMQQDSSLSKPSGQTAVSLAKCTAAAERMAHARNKRGSMSKAVKSTVGAATRGSRGATNHPPS
jgi:hypothetical protein